MQHFDEFSVEINLRLGFQMTFAPVIDGFFIIGLSCFGFNMVDMLHFFDGSWNSKLDI
jgi:hypothetical protein